MSKRALTVATFILFIVLSALFPSFRASVQSLAIVLLGILLVWWFVTSKRPFQRLSGSTAPSDSSVEQLLNEIEQQTAVQPSQPSLASSAAMPMSYTIKVPKDTAWRPELATALAREFVAFGGLALQITARDHAVQWQVMDFRSPPLDARLITQTVRNVYPNAEVVPGVYQPRPLTGRVYRRIDVYEQVQDFVGPIRAPHEFRQSDPLAIVANVLNDLEPGESATYTVYVGETKEQFYKDAQAQTTTSNWTFQNVIYITLGFLTIVGAVVSAAVIAYKLFVEKRPDKYRESDMNFIYGKLNDVPLIRAHLLFEVNSPSEARLKHFDIQPALLDYAHEFQKLMRQSVDENIVAVTNAQQDAATDSLAQLRRLLSRHYVRYKEGRKNKNAGLCILSPSEVASLWHLPHEGFAASNITWVKGKYVSLPGMMRGSSDGVLLGDNLYGGRHTPVYMLPKDRAGHMIIVGKTGMGKSTLLHNMIHQDIASGRGVALIDPSPREKNLVSRILQSSIPNERMEDVVVLDLSDRVTPPPFNILSTPINVPRRDAVASIRAIFERVYGSTLRDARMGRTLGMALHTVLADETPTIRDIARVVWDVDYREALLDNVTSEGALDFWDRFVSMSAGEQEAYFEPILGRLEALYDNELLYPAVCHPESLDLGSYIQQGKIILISLCPPENVGLAPSEQALLGSILVSQFQLAVMAQRPPERFYLYVDEAQHFVTTALPELFNEARGQHLSLTLSNQFLKQLVGETLHAVMGNVGAILSFQVGTDDAHALASDIMKPHFSSFDLAHMEVHHAAVFMRYEDKQQDPFSLAGRDAPQAPADAVEREAQIRASSRQQYTPRSREEVLTWLAERYPRRRRARGKVGEEQFSEPL